MEMNTNQAKFQQNCQVEEIPSISRGVSTKIRHSSRAFSISGMKVSIVVPAYKESKNMEPLITRISSAISNFSHEIIVVDDNSKDGTDTVIKQLQQQKHKVRLITRVSERGLSSAVLKGFVEARGEYVICMDADLQHPPEALPEFIKMLDTFEFVIGTRFLIEI